MNFWSLVFAILALACFVLDFFAVWPPANGRWGRLISLGLAFLTASWMAQLLIVEHPITL